MRRAQRCIARRPRESTVLCARYMSNHTDDNRWYIFRQICFISSNLKNRKCCLKKVIGPYFQDQHIIRKEDKRSSCRRKVTYCKEIPGFHFDINSVIRFPELCMSCFCFHQHLQNCFCFVVYVWCCFVLLVVYVWCCFVFVCYVCLMFCFVLFVVSCLLV